MSWRCFLLTPTDQCLVSLRRYRGQWRGGACSVNPMGYHDADVIVGVRKVRPGDVHGDGDPDHPHTDPRWPAACVCGYRFVDEDEWQVNPHVLYRRGDTGALTRLRDAPIGAMWDAHWDADMPEWTGPDGLSLHVRIPGENKPGGGKHTHDWCIDSRASNCDSPCAKCSKPYHSHGLGCDGTGNYPGHGVNVYVDARPHKCWIRHGTPPDIHVDKAGLTCNAGAGSIQVPGYHGFLHNGHVTDG